MKNLPDVTESVPIQAMGEAQSRYASSDAMRWHESKPGVFTKLLYEVKQRSERTLLVRLDPGASSLPHSHGEFEQIYVIEGSFDDGERVLSTGDFCCRSPEQEHTAWSPDGALVVVTYTAPIVARERDELL